MIGANFLSITISNSFSNNSYANTIIISLLFLIFYSLNSFVKYLCNLLSAKKIKTNYLKMTDIFIKSIKNKNETFLHKVNKNYLYIIDHCINSITTYNTVELTNFLSSFIFGFALIVYIGIIAPIFISICVCITILFSILGYIECKYKQKLLSRVVNNGSNNSSICSQYISCLSKNQMGHMTNNLLEKFKGNYSEYINLFGQTSKFNGGVNLINEISEKILLIIAVIMSSFFLQTYFHSDIAKIILLVTLIGMFFNNVNTIINFISLHVEYKMLLEIFNNIIGIGNKNVGEYDFSKTKSITYKKQKIFNGWHIKENDGNFKDVLTKYKNSDLITINNINISDVKTEWINNNVYTFDSYQEINPSLLLKGISENKCLIDFIKENGVDIMKMNEKIEHYQLLNVLYCTTLKNKIIVFNKNLSYIDKKYMDSIKKKIIPYIKKNNYLIFIDKTT
jgi:ABC-type bacteriocin/lantibiotic exporter with double-glycine peptidase domain